MIVGQAGEKVGNEGGGRVCGLGAGPLIGSRARKRQGVTGLGVGYWCVFLSTALQDCMELKHTSNVALKNKLN